MICGSKDRSGSKTGGDVFGGCGCHPLDGRNHVDVCQIPQAFVEFAEFVQHFASTDIVAIQGTSPKFLCSESKEYVSFSLQ